MKTVAGENIILHICVSWGCHPALGGTAALQLVTALAWSCREAHPKAPRRLRRWMWADTRGSRAMGKCNRGPKAASRRRRPCRGSPRCRDGGCLSPRQAAQPLLARAAARWDGACTAAKAPLPRLSPAVLLPRCHWGGKQSGFFIYLFSKKVAFSPQTLLYLAALYF